MRAARPVAFTLAAATVVSAFAGCVRRTITITTEPDGALVWLNDREVGRTPLDVEFLYYGTYDVRIVKDGYEPLLTSGDAKPPIWDNVGPDLVAELLPFEVRSEIRWHYVLEPRADDRAALIERAAATRDAMPPPPPPPPQEGQPEGGPDAVPDERADG